MAPYAGLGVHLWIIRPSALRRTHPCQPDQPTSASLTIHPVPASQTPCSSFSAQLREDPAIHIQQAWTVHAGCGRSTCSRTVQRRSGQLNLRQACGVPD